LFEGYRLDRRGLFRQDELGTLVPIAIGSRALDVLGILVERQGQLVSKDDIVSAVWPETVVEESNRAIGLLRQARASNPRLFYVHLHLALGLKGDLDEARSALAEGIKLKPEVNSLAGLRSWGNPRYWELCEKTLHAGLSRAGMPDA
jgi:hypothetical protein